MKALELAERLENPDEYDDAAIDDAAIELRKLAETSIVLLDALKAVCKEFEVFKFPLNEFDMSQAAIAAIRARFALDKFSEL